MRFWPFNYIAGVLETMGTDWRFFPLGDNGILVVIGDRITEDHNRITLGLHRFLEDNEIPGITESAPAYCSLAVFYDPLSSDYNGIVTALQDIRPKISASSGTDAKIIEVPVVYGGEFGPDLEFVAWQTGLSGQEVISLHSQNTYIVGMLGFTPGFPYLTGLHPKLTVPRKAVPRLKIPIGSVGIAGRQTGIYPVASPGGWQIIGRTPLQIFLPHRSEPFLFRAGDQVVFKAVAKNEFNV